MREEGDEVHASAADDTCEKVGEEGASRGGEPTNADFLRASRGRQQTKQRGWGRSLSTLLRDDGGEGHPRRGVADGCWGGEAGDGARGTGLSREAVEGACDAGEVGVAERGEEEGGADGG